jgi:hypothetical protein
VSSVTFSPDGKQIIAGCGQNKVRIWNAATGALQTLEGHTGSVNSVAVSSDGMRIVSGSADNTVIIWEDNALTAYAVLASLKKKDNLFAKYGNEYKSDSTKLGVNLENLPDGVREEMLTYLTGTEVKKGGRKTKKRKTLKKKTKQTKNKKRKATKTRRRI